EGRGLRLRFHRGLPRPGDDHLRLVVAGLDRDDVPGDVHRTHGHDRLLPAVHGTPHGGPSRGPARRGGQRGLRGGRLLPAAQLVADRPGRLVQHHDGGPGVRAVPRAHGRPGARGLRAGTAVRVLRRHQPHPGADAGRAAGARGAPHEPAQVPGRL
ncbi:MAG: Cytochrome c oxidase polypeptide IV, partial [uncultured Frankineae bacterium]